MRALIACSLLLLALPARAGGVIINTYPTKIIQPVPPVAKGLRGALIVKPHP